MSSAPRKRRPRTHDWVVRRRAGRIQRRTVARLAKQLAVAVAKLALSALGALVAAFFDPLVVVTVMTTLSLIVGLLAYASTAPGGPSREIILLCWVIGLFGLFTIILQVYKILKKRLVRKKLGRLWVRGHNLCNLCFQHEKYEYAELLAVGEVWQKEVIAFLRKEFDESYVARFCSQPRTLLGTPTALQAPYADLWRGINNGLTWLDSFSKELWKE